MAGMGPPPKAPGRRARTNGTPQGSTIRFVPCEQPPLPDNIPWPEQTLRWWAMWAETAQAEGFTATDWDELLTTALIHADVWSGNLDRAGELRLRVAKFGATPEDRARLRMVFADADAKEGRSTVALPKPKQYEGLRAV